MICISNWPFGINITWLLPLVFGKNIGFSESLIRCQINAEKLLQMIKVASFVSLIGPFGLGKISSSINHEKHFNFPWQRLSLQCIHYKYTRAFYGEVSRCRRRRSHKGSKRILRKMENKSFKTMLPWVPVKQYWPAHTLWTLCPGHTSEIWSKAFVSKWKKESNSRNTSQDYLCHFISRSSTIQNIYKTLRLIYLMS